MSFTALPSWLKHKIAFQRLAESADSFVLQVHSLEKPKSHDAPITLCDPAHSIDWIKQAASLGTPFHVALPTYGYELIFDQEGNFKSIVAEGPRLSQRPNSLIRVIHSDPVAMAKLAQSIKSSSFPNCLGLIWFRLPIQGERLNWAPSTFEIILKEQIPQIGLNTEVSWDTDGLASIYLENTGETSLPFPPSIHFKWTGGGYSMPIAWDSSGIFSIQVDQARQTATISTRTLPATATLSPGQRIALAWLRFPLQSRPNIFFQNDF